MGDLIWFGSPLHKRSQGPSVCSPLTARATSLLLAPTAIKPFPNFFLSLPYGPWENNV
jgi:hypothetical protein